MAKINKTKSPVKNRIIAEVLFPSNERIFFTSRKKAAEALVARGFDKAGPVDGRTERWWNGQSAAWITKHPLEA